MTIAELITELQKHSPEANVYINDNEYGLNALKSVIKIDPKKELFYNTPVEPFKPIDIALQWWEANE